jgi:polysaccharide export outer membrane protein
MVQVSGKTRSEVEQYLKTELQARNLCKDAVVIIQFHEMTFSVLGDAKQAGTKNITKDKLTIFEALAMAGDLDMQGKRTNVMVLRQEGGLQKPYWIDLTDTRSIYNSPVFYIQQNDVIYIEPNDMHKRSTTAAGSTVYTPSFWISSASLLSTLAVLIVNIIK